jgi:hypothetical protein
MLVDKKCSKLKGVYDNSKIIVHLYSKKIEDI